MGYLTIALVLPKEPRYQHRTLTQWLEPGTCAKPKNPFRNFSPPEPTSPVTQSAIKAIGTNAIPTLLKTTQAKDSSLRIRLNTLLDRQTLIAFRFRTACEQRAMGIQGFEVLGEDGKSAAPALALLIKDPDAGVRYAALESLRRVKPVREIIVPVLLKACSDPAPEIRFVAAVDLHFRCPQELERAGLTDPIIELHSPETAH